MSDKKLYNFQQILPFNKGPVFPEHADKTVGELTDVEAVQSHEDWIRAQFGHMQDYYRPHLAMLLSVIDELRARTRIAAPIKMILFCPVCGLQHIDAPEASTGWTNPPHKSHLCHGCGTIWRPCDLYTDGVRFIDKLGQGDTWSPRT